jgi:Ca2+/Na+ antiporter
MKHLFLLLLTLHTANAAEISIHDSTLYFLILFLFLLMTSTFAFSMNKGAKKDKIIQEKEEKIAWLRQIHAENEHKHLKTLQENEKEKIALEHTIQELERKLQEGTKNQVVAKIEALEKKRQSFHTAQTKA